MRQKLTECWENNDLTGNMHIYCRTGNWSEKKHLLGTKKIRKKSEVSNVEPRNKKQTSLVVLCIAALLLRCESSGSHLQSQLKID